MDNSKDDNYYLDKIFVELNFIIEYTKNKTLDDLRNDKSLLRAIMFSFIQISENNEKLSTQFKENHKEISWKAMKGMRNLIVHNYGKVDLKIVYNTIKVSIPEFEKQLKNI